jgi:hypothetical protein
MHHAWDGPIPMGAYVAEDRPGTPAHVRSSSSRAAASRVIVSPVTSGHWQLAAGGSAAVDGGHGPIRPLPYRSVY